MAQPPTASVFLCATPRSGSTLLCTLLRQIDRIGQPESWFRAENRVEFARDWGLPIGPDGKPAFADVLTAAIRAGRGAGATFALRLMWPNLPELCADLVALHGPGDDLALLTRAFGPIRFLWLRREDTVAQAISRHRAEASGLWHRNPDGTPLEMFGDSPRPVPYDAAAITRYYQEIDAENTAWARWFDRHGIAPLPVSYAELSREPGGTVLSLLRALGIDNLPDAPQPGTARLADRESADWAARFRAEHGMSPTGEVAHAL